MAFGQWDNMGITISNRLLALAFCTGATPPVFLRNLGFLTVIRTGAGRFNLTYNPLNTPFAMAHVQLTNAVGARLRTGIIRTSNTLLTCVFQAAAGGADTDPAGFSITLSAIPVVN